MKAKLDRKLTISISALRSYKDYCEVNQPVVPVLPKAGVVVLPKRPPVLAVLVVDPRKL